MIDICVIINNINFDRPTITKKSYINNSQKKLVKMIDQLSQTNTYINESQEKRKKIKHGKPFSTHIRKRFKSTW